MRPSSSAPLPVLTWIAGMLAAAFAGSQRQASPALLAVVLAVSSTILTVLLVILHESRAARSALMAEREALAAPVGTSAEATLGVKRPADEGAALRASERRFRDLAESLPHMV